MFDFNVEQFLATSYDQATSTQRLLFPSGVEAVGLIEDVKVKNITSQKGSFVLLEVTVGVEGPLVKEHLKRDKTKVQGGIMLDLIKQPNGNVVLDMSTGMNVTLGQLRDAVGQNRPGESWNPTQLKGQPVGIKLGQRPGENEGEFFQTIAKWYKP